MRRAFSMLELIVSIVIMGIAVSALPMLIQTSNKNIATALEQENILKVKSQISQIMSADWSKASYKDGQTKIVTFDDSDVSALSKRYGLDGLSENSQKKTTDLTDSDEDFPSIDDFSSNSVKKDKDKETKYDYIFDTELEIKIESIQDDTPPDYAKNTIEFTFTTSDFKTNSNIKLIEVSSLKDSTATITLRAYSSNIGESKLGSKPW